MGGQNMMKKGQNYNHPVKGSRIKVGPITSLKDIKTIKNLLDNKPLDLCIFVVGINTALRASDLLNLKVWQVKDLKPGDDIEIVQKKTSKYHRINFNKAALHAIHKLLNSGSYDDTDYLFNGQRGRLTVSAINAKVKSWTKIINLRGNFGSHTLRKTWGYHQRVTFGVDIPTLMKCFGHSYQKETLDYLCIQDEEIKKVFENEL